MSFFKKIFGGSTEKPEQEPKDKLPVDRAPRIRLAGIETACFVDSAGFSCQVGNISRSGISLEVPPDKLAGIQLKQTRFGDLMINDDTFGLQLEIMRMGSPKPNVIGCRFISVPPNFAFFLEDFFHVEMAAAKMVKIDSKVLKENSEAESFWYRGPENSELWVSCKDGVVLDFTLAFLGYKIEGSKGARTTLTKIDLQVNKKAYDDTSYKSVKMDQSIEALVRRFLEGIPSLSASFSEQILKSILRDLRA